MVRVCPLLLVLVPLVLFLLFLSAILLFLLVGWLLLGFLRLLLRLLVGLGGLGLLLLWGSSSSSNVVPRRGSLVLPLSLGLLGLRWLLRLFLLGLLSRFHGLLRLWLAIPKEE